MSQSIMGSVRVVLFAILLLPAHVVAQQTGSIAGTVRPAEGVTGFQAGAAGLSAVQVDALEPDGNVAATVLTGEEGGYRLFVPPGTYTVVFTVPGWETVREPGVVVAAGETTPLSVRMAERAFDLNPITITASKTEEKAIEAPAAVEVVSSLDIIEQPATTVAEHVKGIAAVDVIKSGLQGNYVVVRGFNNIFSGATLTLTDNRIARVPSLRANVLHLNPTTNLDIERVEVVLGPGSALYGPNAANGVIHTITKSPIDYPGGAMSVATGIRQQDDFAGTLAFDTDGDAVLEDVPIGYEGGAEPVYQVEGRYALKLSDQFGVKLSGQYFQGEEYRFIDPQEFQARTLAGQCQQASYSPANPACQNFTQGLDFSPENTAESVRIMRQSVDNLVTGRDFGLERFSGELRADWRPTDDLGFIVSGGRTQAVSSIDLTGLGAAQVENWGYNYVQLRGLWKDAFAQVFFNQSDNDDTYLLRTGRPLVDKSSLLVAQLQNMTDWAGTEFVYGLDFLSTVPQTEGTINGGNEEDDEVTEVGGYVQSQTPLGEHFEVMLAARVDHHSVLDDPVFSPRAGLVWMPADGHSLRTTYNRAFSTPTTLNLFLDISGGTVPLPVGRYDVRAQGTTRDGLHFNFGPNGLPMHQNPFAPLTGFGASTAWQPTTTPHVWDEVVAVVGLQADETTVAFLQSLEPTAADIAVEARTLNVEEQVFEPTPGGINSLTDVPRLDPTITNTFEIGYKGLLGDRLLLGANAYYSRIDDFTSALRIVTPTVFLNTEDVRNYLEAGGLPPADAAALAVAIGGDGTADNPGIPIGAMTMREAGGTDPALILSYQNLGEVDLFGADLNATVILNNQWELGIGAAWVSDDEFVANEGTATEEIVSLNAPTVKATGSVRYRNAGLGVNGQLRTRYVNGFPANSGVYTGEVDSYNVVDLTLGYRIPTFDNVMLTVDVQNVLDREYASFVGTPQLGRFALLRLLYEF